MMHIVSCQRSNKLFLLIHNQFSWTRSHVRNYRSASPLTGAVRS